jgi:5-methylcytosine-specific restriction endonuclease McrA
MLSIPDSPQKRCPTCQEWLPLDAFNKDRNQADGKSVYCRMCRKAYDKRWRDKNMGYMGRYLRSYLREVKTNGPRPRANKSELTYQERRKDVIERWQRTHREERHAIAHRSRSRRSVAGHHTANELRALYQWFGHCCLSCGRVDDIAIDHVVPISKGGANTINNLQPLCKSCNSRKATKTIDYRDPDRLAAFLASVTLPPGGSSKL